MNDLEIIALFFARQENAISATADKYGNYCHAIAYNILFNNSDAEECVNDTYLGAWNSIPPQKPNNLAAYLGKSPVISHSTVTNAIPSQNEATVRLKLPCPSWKIVYPIIRMWSRQWKML